MDVAAFLRAYQMRARNVMWFLGAGASRSAGIKTAGDMIWDFKQQLYRSEKKLPPTAITDPGDPAVRNKLQKYFDEYAGFPAGGAEDEYAGYFEATYPTAKDRRAYLDSLIKAGKPSYGHMALALLMREQLSKIVWTTNFDRTVEDAAAQIFGSTTNLVVADLGEPRKVMNAMSEERFPIYGKLHGDYHSDALKNTTEELRAQDAEMRKAFVDACKASGLAVVGYSGRDASVMEALHEAIDDGNGFPNGLFWFKRSGDTPFEGVVRLIEDARANGVDAHLIDNETFDELMSDVIRFLPQTADKLQSIEGAKPPRLASAPLKPTSTRVPVIRTNALPILSRPVMCRFIDCNIGGWRDIREAIEKAGVDIDAQRISGGVIAFGRDADIRAAFEPFGIKTFDTRSIPDERLVRESGDKTLIREALFRALSHRPDIEIQRRGRRVFALPKSDKVKASHFSDGKWRPVDAICGEVGNTGIKWTESCELRLDYRLDRLWLLLEPGIRREIPEDTLPEHVAQSKEFVRSRMTARFNPKANALLGGWARLLVGEGPSISLKGFGISDGIDPDFEISSVTGFSGVSQ